MKLKKDKISDFIYYIHQNIGARIAGSREEKLAARYIKSALSQITDKTDIESFLCNPRSTQHEFNLICILYLLALIAYIMYPPATVFFIFLYGIYILLIKIYDIRIMDLFFSKSKSQNVSASIKPFNEIKNTVIFTAHIDSPYVNKIFENKYKEYLPFLDKVFPLIFIILLIITITKISHAADILIDYLYLLPFLAIAGIIYLQNQFVTYDKSFGANNDLSGVAVNVELAKHFFIERTDNTQIMFISFGAKEANMSGAKDFLKKNYELLKNSYLINLESVAAGAIYILSEEKKIKHNSEIIKLIIEAAQKENIRIDSGKSDIITTDATVFSYEKMKSVSFLSFDKYGIPLRYCLKEDLPQYMFEEDLQNVFKICVKVIELIDEREKRR